MKLHWPLLKSLFVVFSLLALIFLFSEKREFYFLWFLALFLYTHFFEYVYHRILLHKIIFPEIWKNHMKHHFYLRGDTFATRDEKRLEETLTSSKAYIILFSLHYLVFIFLFPNDYAISAFSGITAHFVFYQTTHWLTHVKNSILYWIANYFPMIANQIKHHGVHHNNFVVNFNFCPPYAGDRIFKTKK